VIGVRSFGSDAAAVARHTAAYIEGMQDAGVASCAKHFPGHGDTAIDSHLDLPAVAEDPHLRALGPFASAIEYGVQSIMSAHVVVSAIDDAPVTLSPRIMTGLLRSGRCAMGRRRRARGQGREGNGGRRRSRGA